MRISLSLFYHIFQQTRMKDNQIWFNQGILKNIEEVILQNLFLLLSVDSNTLCSRFMKSFNLRIDSSSRNKSSFFPKSSSCDTCDHSMMGRLTLLLFSPVLGVIPELCQCRDLELDCDGTQLQDIPAVAMNVTMM